MARVGPSGYRCLRGRVCVREAHAAISGASCDYDAMAAYVRRVVSTVLGRDATGAKFRVSDNDNTDAAAFHRDAIRAPGATPFELLTCIVYLDNAAMQVIPGSHLRTYGAVEALAMKPRTLEFRAGDVMLFHAELVHRAKLTTAPRRRVLQIFDIAFCASDARRVAHVVSSGSSAGWWVARAPVIGHVARLVGYLHSMTGYGPFCVGEATYLSSEGFSGRIPNSPAGGARKLGLYCTLAPTVDVDRGAISASVYTLPQLRILAVLAALAALAVLVGAYLCARFGRSVRGYVGKPHSPH